MMFDQNAEQAAIGRTVSRDDETVTVTLTRDYDAHAAEVWDVLTNPERIPRWFMPITGELHEGGSFQLEGNAGGEVRRCDPPKAFQVTFGGPDSLVDVTLREDGRRTTVELVHRVPIAMAGSGAGALYVGPGWDGALMGLGLYLRGDFEGGDPREAANSPEVIAFNTLSIDAWTTAVETSGTATADELAAGRQAAIAQYTVLPE